MGDKPGRFEEPDPATMSAEQREIYDRLLDGRGKLPGPYRVWLENPAFSEATERLSQQVRFASDIPNRLKELAIIVTVRHWRAQYAWHSHAAAARKAGIGEAVIAAIRDRAPPVFEQEDEAAVYAFCRESLEDRAVTEATWRQAVAAIGRAGVIDLIGLIGFYCMVAFTLNAYEIPPAGGAAPELKD